MRRRAVRSSSRAIWSGSRNVAPGRVDQEAREKSDVLLRAVTGLDAETVIIGDGPLRSALESLACNLGITDRVHFLGEVAADELHAWYHAYDVFVLPSVTRQEAFGMVQLEAMLCGRPCVSTDVGTGVSWVN